MKPFAIDAPSVPAWHKRLRRFLVPALLAGIIFSLDSISDVDVVSILYVNVILLAARSRRREDILIAGCGSIGLTIISFLLTLSASLPLVTLLTNNGLSLLAISCVMILCIKNLESQTEVVRARERIDLIFRDTVMQTMSAAIVHEITQPLTAIGASAQAAHRWVQQTPPNCEETRRASRRVVAEVDRASDVIRRLERLTMPEQMVAETFSVGALLEHIVERLQIEIDDAGVDVVLAYPSELKVSADQIMIEQVLINAFTNAIDALRAAPPGNRSITVEARALQGVVKISVADSGPGADAATLQNMFDPFFTTKVGSGMGIGLAVSKSIINAHGGKIQATSNRSDGLVLEIELPSGSCSPGAAVLQ